MIGNSGWYTGRTRAVPLIPVSSETEVVSGQEIEICSVTGEIRSGGIDDRGEGRW